MLQFSGSFGDIIKIICALGAVALLIYGFSIKSGGGSSSNSNSTSNNTTSTPPTNSSNDNNRI